LALSIDADEGFWCCVILEFCTRTSRWPNSVAQIKHALDASAVLVDGIEGEAGQKPRVRKTKNIRNSLQKYEIQLGLAMVELGAEAC
jgi:hypothetical protein